MQVHLAGLQEVVQAARGGDDQADPSAQVGQLGVLGRTSIAAPAEDMHAQSAGSTSAAVR